MTVIGWRHVSRLALEVGDHVVVAVGLATNEFVIEDAARIGFVESEKLLHDFFENGDVSVHANRQVESGNLGSAAKPAPEVLRMDEAFKCRFKKRVDRNDLCSAISAFRAQPRPRRRQT